MTLTTHAIVGTAVVSLIPQHPVLGLCAAFVSHFAADAIPHWDYPIASSSVNPHFGMPMKYDKSFWVDVARIGSDGTLGVILSVLFFAPVVGSIMAILGAIAGMLPDPLQFVYAHFKHEPLVSLQRFHTWIHTNNHLENRIVFGVFSQILFVTLVVSLARFFA